MNINCFELTIVVRQHDPKFMNMLAEIRLGTCTKETGSKLKAVNRKVRTAPGSSP